MLLEEAERIKDHKLVEHLHDVLPGAAGCRPARAALNSTALRRGVDRGAVHRSGGVRLVGRGSGSGSTFPVAGSGPVLRHGVAGDGPSSEAIFCRRLAKGGSSGGGFRAAMAAEVDAALRQREELDRPLLTRRRDLEQLFGVSRGPGGDADEAVRRGADRPRADAAACRVAAAAADVPEAGRLPRGGAAARASADRAAQGPSDRYSGAGSGRSASGAAVGPAAGLLVEPGRIEVRFAEAKEALTRLYALAQALVNDFEDFEALVGGERTSKDRD